MPKVYTTHRLPVNTAKGYTNKQLRVLIAELDPKSAKWDTLIDWYGEGKLIRLGADI